MDLARFRSGVSQLRQLIERDQVLQRFQNVVNNLSNAAANPTATQYLEAFRSELDILRELLSRDPYAWTSNEIGDTAAELHIESLLGEQLLRKILDVLDENKLSAVLAAQRLGHLLQVFNDSLTRLH